MCIRDRLIRRLENESGDGEMYLFNYGLLSRELLGIGKVCEILLDRLNGDSQQRGREARMNGEVKWYIRYLKELVSRRPLLFRVSVRPAQATL